MLMASLPSVAGLASAMGIASLMTAPLGRAKEIGLMMKALGALNSNLWVAWKRVERLAWRWDVLPLGASAKALGVMLREPLAGSASILLMVRDLG